MFNIPFIYFHVSILYTRELNSKPSLYKIHTNEQLMNEFI